MMAMRSIIKGFKWIGKLERNERREIRAAVRELSRWTLNRVKEKTPKRLGTTRDKWKVRMYRPPEKGFRVYNTSKVADYLEYGSRPHIIRPRSKRALTVFPADKQTGPLVALADISLVAWVKHPGTKPLGIVKSTLPETRARARKTIPLALRNGITKTLK